MKTRRLGDKRTLAEVWASSMRNASSTLQSIVEDVLTGDLQPGEMLPDPGKSC